MSHMRRDLHVWFLRRDISLNLTNNDPFVGHLATPITTSGFTVRFVLKINLR